MLGEGDTDRIKAVIASFHEHWDELENRRKKPVRMCVRTGSRRTISTMAIAMRLKQLECCRRGAAGRVRKVPSVLLGTKDLDNTLNDRVFDRSKAYGTAMAVLALSRESVLLPRRSV